MLHLVECSCRPSPLNLIQERFTDPWQHLVCCLLCRCACAAPHVEHTHFYPSAYCLCTLQPAWLCSAHSAAPVSYRHLPLVLALIFMSGIPLFSHIVACCSACLPHAAHPAC